MGKRVSNGSGKSVKKSAKAVPPIEEKMSVEDDQWLWSKIQDFIRLIRDAGHGPKLAPTPCQLKGSCPWVLIGLVSRCLGLIKIVWLSLSRSCA